MAGITVSGIGSGLDIQSIISQLMAIERQPLNRLNQQQASYQSKLSAYGQLQSALSTLQTKAQNLGTTQNLTAFQATSSDSTTLTATASNSAIAGTYNITVSQLAQAQSLATAGQSSSSAAIGSGASTTVAITVGGTTTNVTINSTNNSLNGIASAINGASAGVSASVVNTGTSASPSYKLLVTSSTSGAAGSVTVGVTGDTTLQNLLSYPAGGGGGMTQLVAAQDAQFTVNGLNITRSSNTVSDVISGVTLNLLKVNASPTTLTVSNDSSAFTKSVQDFVNAFNSLATTTNQLTLNQPNGTNNGPLAGDNTPNQIIFGVQNTITQYVGAGTAGYRALSQLGITTQSDGTLSVDATALAAAYNANPSAAAGLVSRLAQQTNSLIQSYTGSGGYLSAIQDGLNSTIQDLQDQALNMQTRLSQIQQQYTAQYSALDALLGQLQSTSNWLSQQLAAIPLPK